MCPIPRSMVECVAVRSPAACDLSCAEVLYYRDAAEGMVFDRRILCDAIGIRRVRKRLEADQYLGFRMKAVQ